MLHIAERFQGLWQIEAAFVTYLHMLLQALLNTVLVIGIVGASSVVLFAINSTLAELSKISYK